MTRDGLFEGLPAQRGFLLIHGAMHGGWCWDRLIPYLRHQSLAIDLPGHGATAAHPEGRCVCAHWRRPRAA
jgi:pimeloyl-ACP methyl ester carboxylesterase